LASEEFWNDKSINLRWTPLGNYPGYKISTPKRNGRRMNERNARQTRLHSYLLPQKFVGVPLHLGRVKSSHCAWTVPGLMIWVLQVFGVLDSGDWTADGLSQLFERRRADPWERGDLVFYGKGKITHVMMYIGRAK